MEEQARRLKELQDDEIQFARQLEAERLLTEENSRRELNELLNQIKQEEKNDQVFLLQLV